MLLAKLAFGLFAAVLAHLAAAALAPEAPRFLDLFALVAILSGLSARPLVGLLGGVLAGFTHDLLAGSPFGLYAFADTFAGYLSARVSQRIVLERASAIMLATMVATLVQQSILYLLVTALLTDLTAQSPIWWVVKAAANGLLAFMITAGQGGLEGARERRRRDRVDRLRLSR